MPRAEGHLRSRVVVPVRLTAALVAVMAVQAALGLLFSDRDRDADWIRATWFGNDLVTLSIAVPLLVAGAVSARRGSSCGLLVWLGVLGYSVYNYAFYLFGAALNAFLLLYAIALVTAFI